MVANVFVWQQAYIDFELSEGEFERTRELYERLLDRTKHLKVWISYAKFEATTMEETDGVDSSGCIQRARSKISFDIFWFYDSPLFISCFLVIEQVWQLCFCCFLVSGVFEKAINYFRTSAPELKEERAMLLEEWLNLEASFGELGDTGIVQPKLPKKLKKRKQIVSEDGEAGYVC